MAEPAFDVVVVGLGGAGSSTAFHLARAGARVLGIDSNGPANTVGASHGGSRIVRLAYAEGDAFMPLLRRAHVLWDELGELTGTPVLHRCGVLFAGGPASAVVADTIASASRNALPLEKLDAAGLRRCSPQMQWADSDIGCLDAQAGLVRPEAVVRLHHDLARQHGAVLRFNQAVHGWQPDGAGVRVQLAGGAVTAQRLVVCAGGWSPSLAPALRGSLTVQRQVQHWFDVPPGMQAGFDPAVFPVHVWDDGDLFYAMPMLDGPNGGMKCCLELAPPPVDIAAVDPTIHPAEIARVTAVFRRHAPWAGNWLRGAVCHYAAMPDNRFVVGPAPDDDRVILACGLAGHGFKFTPAIGELAASLALGTAANSVALPFDPMRLAA